MFLLIDFLRRSLNGYVSCVPAVTWINITWLWLVLTDALLFCFHVIIFSRTWFFRLRYEQLFYSLCNTILICLFACSESNFMGQSRSHSPLWYNFIHSRGMVDLISCFVVYSVTENEVNVLFYTYSLQMCVLPGKTATSCLSKMFSTSFYPYYILKSLP